MIYIHLETQWFSFSVLLVVYGTSALFHRYGQNILIKCAIKASGDDEHVLFSLSAQSVIQYFPSVWMYTVYAGVQMWCSWHNSQNNWTKVCVLRNSPPPLSLMSVQNCLFFLFFLLVQKFESKNNSFIQQDVIEIVKSDSKDIYSVMLQKISVWNEHCFLFIKESWKKLPFLNMKCFLSSKSTY